MATPLRLNNFIKSVRQNIISKSQNQRFFTTGLMEEIHQFYRNRSIKY